MATRVINSNYGSADASSKVTLDVQFSTAAAAVLNEQYLNAASTAITEIRDLAIGFNAIVVPPSATVHKAVQCIVIFPSTNAATILLKGVTGDTGVAINVVGWFGFALPIDSVGFGITLSAGVAGVRFIWA